MSNIRIFLYVIEDKKIESLNIFVVTILYLKVLMITNMGYSALPVNIFMIEIIIAASHT